MALWGQMLANGETPEELAENMDLPVEAVREAVAWCESHREIVEAEEEEDVLRLRQMGIDVEPAHPDR
jgi:hypothetical protein